MPVNQFHSSVIVAEALFDDLPVASNISYRLSKNAEFHTIGRQDQGTYRKSRQVVTTFGLTYPELTVPQYNAIQDAITDIEGHTKVFLFTDPSDSFCFPWRDRTEKVRQRGVLVPTYAGSLVAVKYYEAGDRQGLRVMRGFHPDAEVKVNGTTVTTGLSRTNGIFTIGTAGDEVTTDHYYVYVRPEENIRITATYARGADIGMNSSVPIVYEQFSSQRFSATITLKEQQQFINLNTPLFNTAGLGEIDELWLQDYVRDSTTSLEYRVKKETNRDFTTVQSVGASSVNRRTTIAPGAVDFSKLMYFTTLYRATSGGALDLTT